MPFCYGTQIREALSRYCEQLPCTPVDPKRFRIPAGDACAALWLQDNRPIRIDPDASNTVRLYEASFLKNVSLRNERLLFSFSDDFFIALQEKVLSDFPHPPGDLENPALNRYLRLSGKEGPAQLRLRDCGLCLLSFCCLGSGIGLSNAVHAEERLLNGLRPSGKAAFFRSAGPFYGALARLTYFYLAERSETT